VVDLVWELTFCLVGLVVISSLLEELDDLLLGDLHGPLPVVVLSAVARQRQAVGAPVTA
jgi:hypothetical protein